MWAWTNIPCKSVWNVLKSMLVCCPMGVKCKNGGIKYEPLEKLITDNVIEKYRNRDNVSYNEDTYLLDKLKEQRAEKEILVKKLNIAIEKINDAFELGDYSREEWLKRHEMRTNELTVAQNDLHELENKINNFSSVIHEEKRKNIEFFLNKINQLSTPEARNVLFSSIINFITWFRKGNDIEMDIQYK